MSEDLAAKVQELIDSTINPAVAGHGGFVELIDVQEDQLGMKARQEGEGLGTRAGLENGVAGFLHDPDQSGPALGLAVHHENRARSHGVEIRPGRGAVNQALDEDDTGPDTGTRRNP